jgi:hypothetical protein
VSTCNLSRRKGKKKRFHGNTKAKKFEEKSFEDYCNDKLAQYFSYPARATFNDYYAARKSGDVDARATLSLGEAGKKQTTGTIQGDHFGGRAIDSQEIIGKEDGNRRTCYFYVANISVLGNGREEAPTLSTTV